MRRIFQISFALSFFLLLFVNSARAQSDITIYSDSLGPGWADWSWCTRDFNATNKVHSGTHSVKLTYGPDQGFYLRHAGFDSTGFTNLVFWINGNGVGGRKLSVAAQLNDTSQPGVNLADYVQGGSVSADTWQQVTIPLSALGVDNKPNFNGFWIQDASHSTQTPLYVDDVSLQAAPPPSQVLINVDAGTVKRTVDSRLFGLNAAVWDSNFNTATTVSLLSGNGTRFMRFPGGSLSDEYHWRTNTNLNNTFQWATNFDAFTNVMSAINGQAIITVNYGTGTPQEAADWVQYANITKGLGYKYWEIGNECYGGWETDSQTRPHDAFTYATRARNYIMAMKAVDPTIKIGVVVITGEDSAYVTYTDHPVANPRTGQMHTGWTPVLLATLKSLGVTPDFVIYHRYEQNPGGEDDVGLLQSAKSWATDAADLRQQVNDYLGAQGPQVELVCTENNSVSSGPGKQTTSLVNGLFYADSLGEILQTEFAGWMWWDLRNGKDTTTNLSDQLYGWRMYGDYGLVSDTSDRYPTYYTSKLMSMFTAGGDQVVQATSNYKFLTAFASKRADGSLALLLINKSPANALSANISVAGFTPPATATVLSYGKPQDEAARTGTGSPDIATTVINNAGTNFTFGAPPYSLSVIVMGGSSCSVSLAPASNDFAAAGGDAQISVVTGAGCDWAAATNDNWIVIHTTSGSGPGTINYTVLENTSGQARQGQITVGNQTFAVSQDAAVPPNCTVTIGATAGKISGSGGIGQITVSASAAACPWQVSTNVSWITIISGANGSGNGIVTFSVTPNPQSTKRKGKITISGNVFTLKQKPGALTADGVIRQQSRADYRPALRCL